MRRRKTPEPKLPEPKIPDLARSFLDEYKDSGVSKRLYFDFWADRCGVGAPLKPELWTEVKRASLQRTWQQRGAKARGATG